MSDHQSIYRKALYVWGEPLQIEKAVEECLELAIALKHFPEGKATAAQVIDEIADVEIMCAQLRIIFGEVLVDYQKEKKLERLGSRLDELSGPMERRVQFLRDLGCPDPPVIPAHEKTVFDPANPYVSTCFSMDH